MRNRLRIGLIPALLVIFPFLASPALAQNRAKTWEIGPFLTSTDFDADTEIKDEFGLGFRFGYNFSPLHEMEFSFDHVDTEDKVTGAIDTTVGKFQTSYVFNFNFDRHQMIIPYVTAGLGVIRFEVSAPGFGSDDENDNLFTWGGGVRFFIGKVFNIRLELRSVFFDGDDVVLRSIGYQDNEFSVGAGWVLGHH